MPFPTPPLKSLRRIDSITQPAGASTQPRMVYPTIVRFRRTSMKTRSRSGMRHGMVTWHTALLACLLLAIQLAGASMAAPQTRASAVDAPSPTGPKAYVALSVYNEVAVVDI